MDDQLADLITATLRRHRDGSATLIDFHELPQPEQGFSGATLRRYAVNYATAAGSQSIILLTKDGPLVERQVLDLLNAQGQIAVPFAHSLDLISAEPALFAMQWLAGADSAPADLPRLAAEGLAAIHAANLGCGAELPWLPLADPHHLTETVINDYWRIPWQQSLQNPEFAAAYGSYTPALELAAERFSAEMEELWQAGDSLTLIHADIQPQLGGHLLLDQGQPYFVDWGQTRYGSFYLDLPNYLNPTNVRLYHAALTRHGIEIALDEFMARYRAAGRYVGFKYLSTLVWFWENGSRGADGVGALDFMLRCALDGRLVHPWSGSGA